MHFLGFLSNIGMCFLFLFSNVVVVVVVVCEVVKFLASGSCVSSYFFYII